MSLLAEGRVQFVLYLILLLSLRVVAAWHYKINSDETQHLHVVWGWTQGLLQYREVFDNHSPLFQMLCAPVFALFPPTPKIVIYMRMAMFPLFAVSVWCVYRIATRLYSPSAGAWSAVIAASFPIFFLTSVEFRTDDLWMAAWLLALDRLLAVPLTSRTAFYGGLTVGVAFAVSMKTVLLAATFGLALGIMLLVARRGQSPVVMLRHLVARGGWFLTGLSLVPIAVMGFFAAQHALGDLYYGTIQHNQTPGMGKPLGGWRVGEFLAALLLASTIAWLISRRSSDPAVGFRRAVLFLSSMLYLSALLCFWPLVTRQNYLPVVPAAAAAIVPGLVALRQFVTGYRRWLHFTASAAPFLLLGLEMIYLITAGKLFQRKTSSRLRWMEKPLLLTDPDDYVMDAKGEMIFRQRPYFWALESVTKARIFLGLIPNNIPERLIQTRTPIVIVNRLDAKVMRFVRANYLKDSSGFYVLGKWLSPADSPASPVWFEVAIPGIYSFVSESERLTGIIDGRHRESACYLKPGWHSFQPQAAHASMAIVWTKAFERGFTPQAQSETLEVSILTKK